MNRNLPPGRESHLFVEALEPRIAPAGLLNELKFTSITAGGSVLLDASDPNGFQGLSTGFGPYSGTYLLYVTAGKALVYTSDLNGNGKVDYNEITGISAGIDSNGKSLDLISFANINGDIVTNLLPGKGVSALTDSDNNPNNGRDGRILLDNGIHSITMRTLTAGDIDTTVPGNTINNRLGLTSFSIFGTIYTGADFGAAGAGLTIDTAGAVQLGIKFSGGTGSSLYTGSTPSIGGIKTGTAASNQYFHFGESSTTDIQGTLLPFKPRVGEHGGNITGVKAASPDTTFDIGSLETGAGGTGANGGDLAEITLHGDRGTYQLIAGDGGQGGSGSTGGSIINFNDLGTVNSSVLIHTGSGGTGLIGAGGKAGTATFATAAIASHLMVVLGDGGDGFTAGAAGASQPSAAILPPEGAIPVGGQVIGTYHQMGDIGDLRFTGFTGGGGAQYAARAIDFDGDGFGDLLYTTSLPDQIVVLFGDGTGSFNVNKRLFLDAPGASLNSIVVADFNGDGRPDIAAASADVNNFGGINLFLNQIGDATHNPLGGKIYTRNPLGNHPFSDALQTPLPTFSDYTFFQGRNPVLSLAAGDFNGDGIMDIGYVSQLTAPGREGLQNFQGITILYGDDVRNPDTGNRVVDPGTGQPKGAGYFVGNLEAPGQAPILSRVGGLNVNARATLTASSLAVNSGAPEVLFYAARGDGGITEVFVTSDPLTHRPNVVGRGLAGLTTPLGLGKVDTNRDDQLALQDAKVQDFAITDLDGDRFADVVALTSQPAGFLVTLKGAPTLLGDFAFTISSRAKDDQGGFVDNNSGILYFAAGVFDDGSNPLKITAVDYKTDGSQSGVFNQFAIEALTETPQVPAIREISLEAAGLPDFYAGGTGVAGGRPLFRSDGNSADDTVTGSDAFYPVVGIRGNPAFPLVARPVSGFGLLHTNTADALDSQLNIFTGPLPLTLEETANGVFLFAGNGGNSTAGVAGNGGVLGTGISTGAGGVVAGSIQFVFPAYLSYQGILSFTGGNGGTGFLGGGIGGDVTGVTTRYGAVPQASGSVELHGGRGGNGIGGDGGRGGDLSSFSLLLGGVLVAGDAGSGLHGGRGGSVLGNKTGVFYDVSTPGAVTAIAGSGGLGALGGGAGGSISNFAVIYQNAILGGGGLAYLAGAGGSAVAGSGGNGGSITDSSPDPTANGLSAMLTLSTGTGGDGLAGGAGGAITNFLNRPTNPTAIPYAMTILTGRGGIGVVNAGGAGGTITNFSSNALGLTSATGGAADLVRIIAGAGGASYGSVGGVGGSILNSTAQAVSSPIAVTGGAGGAGLTFGGDGGSIGGTASTFNSAAQTLGKVLIVAGAGGDASSVSIGDVFVPNNNDVTDLAHAILALGGVSGTGGNGGNITNVTQPVSVQTAVDLIAGNGGSTINYGNSISVTSGVGLGGSVVNVNLAGTVGNSVRNASTGVNPAIRSYTDQGGDGVEDISLDQYTRSLGGTVVPFLTFEGVQIPSPAPFVPAINFDPNLFAQGNVGIVAGIAGRVQGGAPPRNGINGSVQNIAASSFMSIVAGSVDNVARVANVANLTIKNIDGVLGADKSLPDLPPFGGPNNQVEYFDANGRVVSNLEPGFRLIDGAIFAQSITPSAQPPGIAGPRVFGPNTI